MGSAYLVKEEGYYKTIVDSRNIKRTIFVPPVLWDNKEEKQKAIDNKERHQENEEWGF